MFSHQLPLPRTETSYSYLQNIQRHGTSLKSSEKVQHFLFILQKENADVNFILFKAHPHQTLDTTRPSSTDMSFCVIFSSFFPTRIISCSWSVFIVCINSAEFEHKILSSSKNSVYFQLVTMITRVKCDNTNTTSRARYEWACSMGHVRVVWISRGQTGF